MKISMCRISLLIFPLFFIISQNSVLAEYSVSGVRGDVSITREGEEKRQVEINDVIKSGDMLRTRRDSFLIFKTKHLYYQVYPYSAVKIGTEPVLIWGKLGRSEDERFLDIRFFFIPRPAQGRTMKVVVRASRGGITLNSSIEDEEVYCRKLEFYPVEKNEYRAITGFDIEAVPVKYSLNIKAHKDDDHTTVVYPFYLRAMRYSIGRVNIETSKRTLFEPSERKQKEWDVLRTVLSAPSSKAMWNGVFDYPVAEPVIISKFGKERVYFIGKKREFTRYHRGVDFKGETGDPVFMPNNGKVVFAGDRLTTGNTLVVDHGQGVYSLFYHLDSILVEEGALVQKGSTVAEIGATGITAGSHLHWSIYINGVWVNPQDWIEIKF